MKTLDDIVKTSEELGKQIMYCASKIDNIHTFYVIDNTAYYEYALTDDTKKTD